MNQPNFKIPMYKSNDGGVTANSLIEGIESLKGSDDCNVVFLLPLGKEERPDEDNPEEMVTWFNYYIPNIGEELYICLSDTGKHVSMIGRTRG